MESSLRGFAIPAAIRGDTRQQQAPELGSDREEVEQESKESGKSQIRSSGTEQLQAMKKLISCARRQTIGDWRESEKEEQDVATM